MPELPEVETVRRKLEKKLKGRCLKEIDIIYPRIFEGDDLDFVKKSLVGEHILGLKRRGKWLIFEFDDYYLLSHLRMEGKYLYRNAKDEVKKHEHVRFIFDDDFDLRYQDVRKFGRMHLIKKDALEKNPYFAKLGYEPWDPNLTKEYLLDCYKSRNLPIKTVLLDQSIITGIGNIYADEVLFLSKINPFRKAKDLTGDECEQIITNTRKVLEKAILEGGTTIRSYTSEEGVSGLFQNDLLVHKREGCECRVCNNIIKRVKIGGRSTYYCDKCQK